MYDLVLIAHRNDACFILVHRSVAEKLKAGSHVEPELFPEASVYFSDIVSFTTLASESSPMQVVTMLNDLYLMFDTTIAKFNVYKVHLSDNAHLICCYCIAGKGRIVSLH